jgi:hypothetical protein
MTNSRIKSTIIEPSDIKIYEGWLKRMALKFLENPDNEVVIFLEDHRNNLIPAMIQMHGLSKVMRDLTKTIDSLR